MNNALTFLASFAAVTGLLAAATSFVYMLTSYRLAKLAERELGKQMEKMALGSNDLHILGKYLYNDLGSVALASYANNPEVSAKVKRALDRIAFFLGKDPIGLPKPPTDFERPKLPPIKGPIDSEMEKAREEILYGEVWNGLARLRRYIEQELKKFSGIAPGDAESGPTSIGRLIYTLKTKGRLTTDTASRLQYAVQVANAAVHGRDISLDQADEAWRSAVLGLATIAEAL